MKLRVISDNGYKIELIRPLREYPLKCGQICLLEPTDEQYNLVEVFDSQIDEDTQHRIIEQMHLANEEEPKISSK